MCMSGVAASPGGAGAQSTQSAGTAVGIPECGFRGQFSLVTLVVLPTELNVRSDIADLYSNMATTREARVKLGVDVESSDRNLPH